MGIAAGDYENSGLVSFFVTDFGNDYKVLFHNDGDAGPIGNALWSELRRGRVEIGSAQIRRPFT